MFSACGWKIKRKTGMTGESLVTAEFRGGITAYYDSGWTRIRDSMHRIGNHEPVWKSFSHKWHTEAILWTTEDASNTFEFVEYVDGQKKRWVIVTDNSVDSGGTKLAVEKGIDWLQMDGEQLAEFTERLGIRFNWDDRKVRCTVYDLTENSFSQ